MIKIVLNIIVLVFFLKFSFAQNLQEKELYFSALSEYRNGNLNNALQILSENVDSEHFIELTARIYYEQSNYSAAIREYHRLSDFNPSEAYYMLSSVYARMAYDKESVYYLEKHFRYPDPVSMTKINLNRNFDNISRSREWREFWEKPRYTKSRELIDEAEYLVNQGRDLESLRLLSSIRASSLSDRQNYLTARAYFNLRDKNSALHHLNLAINKNRRKTEYYELRLNIYEQMQQDAQALEDIRKIVSLNPYNPDYLVLKAKIENNNKNYTIAAEDIELYLKYFPLDTEALYYLAVVRSNMELYSDALIIYNKLIDIDKSMPEYYNGRADIYYFFEQWRFAILDYTMSLDIKPRQPEVYYNLGWCRFKMNDMPKACNSWKHAARLGNRDAAVQIQRHCRD